MRGEAIQFFSDLIVANITTSHISTVIDCTETVRVFMLIHFAGMFERLFQRRVRGR